MGFPCNQFGGQEPGSNEQIKNFAERKYGITFPLFAKTDVNGPSAHPVWKFLKSARPAVAHHKGAKPRDALGHGGAEISWNFNKFLVGRDGRPIKRYPPAFDEAQLMKDIESLLGL
mmetsp:Transcript_33950/g.83243  ORF Transcript_33950/g.83243 Transcript_33950/m.83243 type:complete len:116 (+) Transcript_33950:357-704(+)